MRYTITIAANSVTSQAVTGQEIVIVDANGPMSVQWPQGDKVSCRRGTWLRADREFHFLSWFNDTSADISCTYEVGSQVPQNILDSETMPASTKVRANVGTDGTPFLNGDNNLELDNNDELDISGMDESGRRRRQIIITNLSDTLDLTILKTSASARRIATVFPRTAWTLETDADLCITNVTGSAGLVCQVMETFFTESEDNTE